MVSCIFETNLLTGTERIIFGVLYSLLSVMGTFGNIRSFQCLVGDESNNNNNTNIILRSLVFSDIVVSLTGLPFLSFRMLYDSSLGKLCEFDVVFAYVNVMATITSSLTVLLLAVDRYLLLAYHHNSWMTTKRVKLFLALIWVTSVCCCALIFFQVKVFAAVRFFFYLTAFIGHVFSYLLVLRAVRQSRANVVRHQENTQASQQSRQQQENALKDRAMQRRVTLKVMVVIVVYYLTFAPMMVLAILLATGLTFKELSRQIVLLLLLANSSLNPIVYIALDERFRNRFFPRWLLCRHEE